MSGWGGRIGPVSADLTRAEVLGFRVRAQQLDRDGGSLADTALLDLGVQDTGPDGGRWALALRGVPADELPSPELVTLWTLRGAPHLYRRADLPSVVAAVAPFSEADAGKRIFDAVKSLKAAGIPALRALDTVAEAMRSVVTEPTVKGAVSHRLAALLPEPYLRFCRGCNATHPYEMPFRLAAVRAGLELRADTSPPVLEPIPDLAPVEVPERRHEVIRGYLRLLGPAAPKDVAGYLDAPVREVKDRWPADAVEVRVEGAAAWALPDDLDRLRDEPPEVTRLLGPFDLLLQAKDRSLLVDDPARAKALWPVLGRPGAVLRHGELVGLWRPRAAAGKLTVWVEPWGPTSPSLRAEVTEQAQRLAAYRGVRFAGLDLVE
jgi:hypothetical protein